MSFRSTSLSRPALRPSAALLLLLMAGSAFADSTTSGEEYMDYQEASEPNVLFLIDRSLDMDDPCPVAPDCYLDEAHTIACPATTDPCIEDVADAIGQVAQHYDWVRYGLAGTYDETHDTFLPIVPLGSSITELSAALGTLTTSGDDTRNFSEALSNLADDYFSNTSTSHSDPWDNAPIEYSCQENHVVIITVQRPNYDDNPDSSWVSTLTSPDLDVQCTWDADTTYVPGPDEQCLLDNVARSVWETDLRSDLDDTQNIILHILLIGADPTIVANTLYGNTHDVQDGEGYWTILGSSDFLLTGLAATLSDIRAGVHSRSTPVLSASGDYLLYSYYEIDGSNPLGEGHLRAYTINTDPADSDYGQLEMYPEDSDHPEEFEGAYWDAGWLLASRPVESGETQPNDMNGDQARDIYTFVDELADAPSYGTISIADRRMTFDDLFVDAVASDESTYLPYFLDTTDATTYNLDDSSDLVVDSDDLQVMVDFLRGYEHSTFRYTEIERGAWKLGDAPHSTPVVVEPRNDSFTVDPTYRTFLDTLENDSSVPSMVYMAANDGMLHAFYLEDNISTTHTEEGEEAWAWIPSYTLYWDHESLFGITWPGRMIDQMLYGRTFLMDGTPVVEDVWLDGTGDYDGVRECDSDHIFSVADLAEYCEWHRVLVVQQGQGGPSTLALDITDPMEPRYLWEQIDLWDTYATGYTVGRPVIAKVYDDRDTTSPTFRWVAIWGSGRAVPSGTSVDYYQRIEPNLYMWGIEDDYFTTYDQAGLSHDSAFWTNSTGLRMDGGGNNGHPESSYSTLTTMYDESWSYSDSDAHFEHGYIAATPAVIDADNDGDADVVYFPVTTTYGSMEEHPTPAPSDPPSTQTADRDYKDPGDTWIWKALVDIGDGTTGMDVDIDWCPTAFFDMDPTLDSLHETRTRPPVYYAITSSWMTDGSLGLYWGTGSPYERYTGDNGYFFAVKDETPLVCSEAVGITCDGQTGYYQLDAGEGLTADPIIWSGVVFFSTYTPDSTDRCSPGVGRVYGLWYEDCSPAVDWDGDGTDEASTTVEGYPSQVAISDEGTIFIGTSDYDEYDQGIMAVSLSSDPLMTTQTLSWMEVF